jgi:PAS domain S-box-containing protein
MGAMCGVNESVEVSNHWRPTHLYLPPIIELDIHYTMECPVCRSNNPTGQKFCGDCGHKLQSNCPQCGAQNPPQYKFCGHCGLDFTVTTFITLAPSGLIAHANQKMLDVLGYQLQEVQGKPFSLFVDRGDLVVFFSHWNEFLGQRKTQGFEIALKHKEARTIYVQLECKDADQCDGDTGHIVLQVKEITQRRLAAAQMQYQQDLLGLMFTLTDSISTASNRHLDQSIEDALKKICLFTKADMSFIYRINRRLRRLDPAYHWHQCQDRTPGDNPMATSVPLYLITRAIVRLRKEKTYAINDLSELSASERSELLAWHQADLGALICHLIYSGKRPIGIIGIAKDTAETPWEPNSVALVKFFGQFVSHRLPFAAIGKEAVNQRPAKKPPTAPKPTGAGGDDNVIDMHEKRPIESMVPIEAAITEGVGKTAMNRHPLPDMTRPMLLGPLSGQSAKEPQPVFPRDDGLVLLTCPRCGFQESISIDQFSRLGNAISVTCTCHKLFSAVLEKRRAFRKSVQLSGFFTLKGDLGPAQSDGSIWGPMVVKDLSKAGLRFSSDRAGLLHEDDLLMVRFNLDNANQSLIHKPARVISVSDINEVGCRFEGSDSYDITLGFYFI